MVKQLVERKLCEIAGCKEESAGDPCTFCGAAMCLSHTLDAPSEGGEFTTYAYVIRGVLCYACGKAPFYRLSTEQP